MSPLYIALVHYPIKDKTGATITTSVTNLDVHDLPRSARAFDVKATYLVNPITAQRAVVDHILTHWTEGDGRFRVPKRVEALARARCVALVDDAVADITEREGQAPRILATAASGDHPVIGWAEGRAQLETQTQPTLILFGTGHGLADEVLSSVDAVLAPIRANRWNHLSVRSAVAITLDRLVGQ